MHLPTTGDTILALATAWRPAALAILRLSGPDAFEAPRRLGVLPPAPHATFPLETSARLLLEPRSLPIPARIFWFRAPRSYTGQNLVEIHTCGALPWLRELTRRLIGLGVRRAWPGEFTARAYLAGKLAAEQVEGVLGLVTAADGAAARQAARQLQLGAAVRGASRAERLIELLARIEAGIDFVDEEDVRFITASDIQVELDALLSELSAELARPPCAAHGRPHVAFAGLPNAGKSTLFNVLLGYERALVSPVLGTTRDVLSAELTIGGVELVLQDCAGLGHTPDELELAAHRAAERTAEQADLVLWVHAADADWPAAEVAAFDRLAATRHLLVISKAEQAHTPHPLPHRVRAHSGSAILQVSAATCAGLDELRAAIAAQLETLRADGLSAEAEDLPTAVAALTRARALLSAAQPEPEYSPAASAGPLPDAELLALELRAALSALRDPMRPPLVEDVLGRIFSRFCIGK
jgi:tRNA modification GTPase